LTRERNAFRAKPSTTDADPLLWRERDHDDLVLALAIALWYAERHPPELPGELPMTLLPGKVAW
jgi:hypothetical protein